jgi:hypothetical protein
MSATLLSPVSSQDLDADLARAAALVVEGVTILAGMSDWGAQALTDANLAGGMLVVLGGATPRPMTTEEFARYQLYLAQVGDIARKWSEGSPPATGIVAPWLMTFRSTGTTVPTP